jgi:hypothetical protein
LLQGAGKLHHLCRHFNQTHPALSGAQMVATRDFQSEVDCAITARQTSFSMVKFLPRVSGTLRLQPYILAILSLAHPVIGRMRLFPANGTLLEALF